MIRRLIVIAALVLPAAGCAAGIRTGFEELHPAAEPVRAERIAVLPVTAAEGSESYRGVIGDSLLAVAQRAHPGVAFVPADESLRRLNDSGLAERFGNMLVAYQQTGIFDRDLLRQAGEALEVDHLLQLRVGYERVSEIENALFDPQALYEADRQNLHVSVVLWDVREGGLVWEAAGTSTTRDAEYERPRSLSDVVAATAAALAERMPLRAGAADTETADEG